MTPAVITARAGQQDRITVRDVSTHSFLLSHSRSKSHDGTCRLSLSLSVSVSHQAAVCRAVQLEVSGAQTRRLL